MTEALRARVAELEGQLADVTDDFVCACGCPWGDHETVGGHDDGFACEHEDHECLQIYPVHLAEIQGLRKRVAELEQYAPTTKHLVQIEKLQKERDQLAQIINEGGACCNCEVDGLGVTIDFCDLHRERDRLWAAYDILKILWLGRGVTAERSPYSKEREHIRLWEKLDKALEDVVAENES